ncbi:MAG: TetR family transcriptional regulator [Pseudomonadota bacterium]
MANTNPRSSARRTQAQRRAETQKQLLDAGRALFVSQGVARTGLPEIVQKAGVTRGALYHHFEDKADLFRAIAEREAIAISELINARTDAIEDPNEAMMVGTDAYFDAMLVPGRAKILLADAPSILGHRAAQDLTRSEGSETLRFGLARAIPQAKEQDIEALTNVLSAAFDRAALEISQGGDRTAFTKALLMMIERLLAPLTNRDTA